MLYVAFMTVLMAEINMKIMPILQILLPIGFALWVRKQSHRFQRNAIKVMLGAGPRKHTAFVVLAELGADTVKSLTGVAGKPAGNPQLVQVL